jgi:hypothetical protein
MRHVCNEKLKKGMEKEGLGGFFFCCGNGRGCFLCDCAFGCAFSYDSEFCGRRVRAASKRVTAFFAFPDADAFAFNSYETALWASVGFFKSRGHSDIPFSDGGAVSSS